MEWSRGLGTTKELGTQELRINSLGFLTIGKHRQDSAIICEDFALDLDLILDSDSDFDLDLGWIWA